MIEREVIEECDDSDTYEEVSGPGEDEEKKMN